MNLGMLGNPITPVMTGLQTLASKWPIITSMAIVNYGVGLAIDMAPYPNSTVNTLVLEGVRGAGDIVKLATWDAAKGAH